MVFIAIGIILGVLVGSTLLGAPAQWLLDLSVRATNHELAQVLSHYVTNPDTTKVATTFQICILVLVPGLLTALVAGCAKASVDLRKGFSTLLVVLGLLSFFALPVGLAVGLFVMLLLIAMFISLASGVLLTIPLAALATTLAIKNVLMIIHHKYAPIQDGAVRLSQMTGAGPFVWETLLIGLSLAPVVILLTQVVTSQDSKDKD